MTPSRKTPMLYSEMAASKPRVPKIFPDLLKKLELEPLSLNLDVIEGIYSQVSEFPDTHRLNPKLVYLACAWIHLRQQKIPLPINEFSNRIGILQNRKILEKYVKRFTSRLDLKIPFIDINAVFRYLRKVSPWDTDIIAYAYRLTMYFATHTAEFHGCASTGIVAGAIYLISVQIGKPISMRILRQWLFVSRKTVYERAVSMDQLGIQFIATKLLPKFPTFSKKQPAEILQHIEGEIKNINVRDNQEFRILLTDHKKISKSFKININRKTLTEILDVSEQHLYRMMQSTPLTFQARLENSLIGKSVSFYHIDNEEETEWHWSLLDDETS